MNGKDIFFGMQYVESQYIQEAEFGEFSAVREAPRHRGLRRPFLIAAIIALMLLLAGCAAVVMGLQRLTIRDTASVDPSQTVIGSEAANLISLQGFTGSTPYKAFKEWQEFLAAYDPDGAILAVSDDFQKPEAYFSYSCYSQEMVDKLEDICEKYGLDPLGKPWSYDRAEDVYTAVGIDSVFSGSTGAEPQNVSGYCYQDGTFSLEGDIRLTGAWDELVSFDYRSVQKTSFDGVPRNIGDVATWDQWNYTRNDGTQVLLALRESGGLIIVDKADSFITVAALGVFANGTHFGDLPTDRTFLEAFCEAFDFSFQTQPVDPAEADALYQARLEREAQEDTLHVTGHVIDPRYLSSYQEFINYMITEEKYSDLCYALMDLNGDGTEELLLHCEHYLNYGGDENTFFQLITMRDGQIQPLIQGTDMYLCEGNVVEIPSDFPGLGSTHEYRTLSEFTELIVIIRYREQEDQWYRQTDEEAVAITKEEANAILAQYPRLGITFRPVSEFPTT